MSTTRSALDITRDWLVLLAAGGSATFAGLIWWLARKRLANRFVLRVGGIRDGKRLDLEIVVTNRSDDELVIEKISTVSDIHLLVTDSGWPMGMPDVQRPDYQPLKLTNRADFKWVIKPDQPKGEGRRVVVERSGGFSGVKKVSIRLHILRSFPVIRHSKKTLSVILPAEIRSAQP